MNPNYLDFEQPIADLEAKIDELRNVGADADLNLADEIMRLEEKNSSLTQKNLFKFESLGHCARSSSSAPSLHPRLYS